MLFKIAYELARKLVILDLVRLYFEPLIIMFCKKEKSWGLFWTPSDCLTWLVNIAPYFKHWYFFIRANAILLLLKSRQ